MHIDIIIIIIIIIIFLFTIDLLNIYAHIFDRLLLEFKILL